MQLKDRKKFFRTILLLFLFAIILDNFLVSKIIPWDTSLLKINPILVILGIPVALPVSMNLVSVFLIFFFLYKIMIPANKIFYKNGAFQNLRKKSWQVCAGFSAIPACTLLAGLIYFFVRNEIPRNFRNAIESFGINADIYALYQDDSVIHFNGSMILLAGFLIGISIFTRKINSIIANSQPAIEQKPILGKERLQQNALSKKESANHVFVQLPLNTPAKPGKRMAKKETSMRI
ncbi:MAG TPA: hypothetical protein VMI12_00360 [Puia sp.]|nr:hypothetical protein [Puia sp.]